METLLPWRPTRGSLTSPSYLVRNRTLGPPLENNPEITPSSRDEGLRLLHGLAGQEATVRTGHGTTDWFQIRKVLHEGCILSPCLFKLHAEYIMRNARLDEAQAGIKIAGRNINNFRYADDTTLMAKSKEELKSLLKVKEESEKTG